MADRVLITGNTYPVREGLKALGGTWDPQRKGWLVPADNESEARALLAPVEAPRRGLPHGQLWQECFCGTEPVCVRCERCERHCRCYPPGEENRARDPGRPGLWTEEEDF
jgi:hypothetical protein